jgi:glycosyltransferase involved in cell wall biosynthesis
MKLLILTQTVDKEDSTLGYYHQWLEELSKQFEYITVFALRIGSHHLPQNVTVIPTRPWGYRARLRTVLRVLRLVWRHRKDYDVVLVHMNQEYLLVAGWLFRILNKRVYMWRNHYEGSLLTDIAAFFCKKVFYTSKSSYTAKYKTAVRMPVGVSVDSCHLEESIERIPRSILFLGRFTPAKRPDLLVEALGILKKEGVPFSATFVGGASEEDTDFKEIVEARARELALELVSFVGAVPNTETYRYYRSHEIYVNLGKSGMLDKSLFKAIACGCVPVFASADMQDMIGREFAYRDGDVDDLASHVERALTLPEELRKTLVETFQSQSIDAHTLPVLATRLRNELSIR